MHKEGKIIYSLAACILRMTPRVLSLNGPVASQELGGFLLPDTDYKINLIFFLLVVKYI